MIDDGELWSVSKDILLDSMSMEVHKDRKIASIYALAFLKKFFELENLNKKFIIGINKLPIKIFSWETSPVITNHNPIWIGHGQDLEHISLSYFIALWRVIAKPTDETLHHIWPIALSRMHSTHHED